MPNPVLDREATYAAVAAQQYGLVTTAQLSGLGLSRASISRRLQSGALIRFLPGVHRLCAVPRCWHQRVLGVQLWAGPSSVVAGAAAAALHRLDGFPQCSSIEIATPRCLRAPAPWVVVRRPRSFPAGDMTEVDRIPVMTCVRTMIDVAAFSTAARLELALEDARRRNLCTPWELGSRLAAMPPNQRGRGRLLQILSHASGTRPTDSALEVRVLQMLRRQGYPEPVRQEVLTDDGHFAGRVDLAYPDRRLIIEVQSHRWHSSRSAIDADSARSNRHLAMGWQLLKVTSSMLRGPERAAFLRDLSRAYRRELP